MEAPVAVPTQRNEVLFSIVTKSASWSDVVDFQPYT